MRASDDPGAVSREARLRTETRTHLRAARNVQTGLTLLSVAANALARIKAEIELVRQQVEDATDDQLPTTTRFESQRALALAKDRVGRLISETTFGTVPILQGDGGGGDLLMLIEAAAVSPQPITLSLPNMQTGTVGGSGTGTLSAVSIRTGADATSALTVIDDAIAEASVALARVQGQETRLQRAEALAQFLATAEGEAADKTVATATHGFARIRPLDQEVPHFARVRPLDIDVPDVNAPRLELRPPNEPINILEVARLSHALIVTRAGVSVLAQANVDARSTLRLLEPSEGPLPIFAARLPTAGDTFTLAELLGLPQVPPPEPQLVLE